MRLRQMLLSAALLTLSVQASAESLMLGDLKAEVWPPAAIAGHQPVIVFSHGFHGCATQSTFLMKALAAHGYWVFAANHHDAVCNGGESRLRDRPASSFRKPETWNDASYRDRADDIRRLIAALKQDARYRDRPDWSRLGLAGHSLGGYTVLALSGAWPSWKLDGVKAVLALSPYAQPFIVKQSLAGLNVPVMYQGGNRDPGITPSIRKNSGAYEQSPAPKYYVEFEGATHFAWSDRGELAQPQIVDYSIAFFDHYLKGLQTPALIARAPGVSAMRYDSELGTQEGAVTPEEPEHRSGLFGRLRERLQR